MGEKPGPTTNGCLSGGPNSKLATKELLLNGTGTEAPTVIEVLKIGECGVGKVAPKDGTMQLGLPWDADGKVIACEPGKAPPEARNVAVCWDKLGDGGMPPEADGCASLAEFAGKLLEAEPGP